MKPILGLAAGIVFGLTALFLITTTTTDGSSSWFEVIAHGIGGVSGGMALLSLTLAAWENTVRCPRCRESVRVGAMQCPHCQLAWDTPAK